MSLRRLRAGPLARLFAAVVGLTVLGVDPSSPLGPQSASAAVSIALSLDELVVHSRLAVVATARERYSVWEELGGSKRIVTYTRLEVKETVFARAGVGEQAPLWVRTLGGAVGEIGQQVAGEAQLDLDKRALVFIGEAPDGAVVVTGLAQGHFPVQEADAVKRTPARLRPSPSIGTVLRRQGPTVSAGEELVGPDLSEAVQIVRKAKARIDAEQKRAR